MEEIGDLPAEVQAKLLTFIETGKFHKIGSIKEQDSNLHIVAATNRENQLRDDFWHRFFPFIYPHFMKEDGISFVI